tara:strand:- start:154 stop:582 length:429 start_codon:yes stop_codon:yes gene_type:complete
MNLSDAKKLLEGTLRGELRDHAFGDREVTWFVVKDGLVVAQAAEGYFGGGSSGVSVYAVPLPFAEPWDFKTGGSSLAEDLAEDAYAGAEFDGRDAVELLECGSLHIERNDSTGPDSYQEGSCLPGLTLEGVKKELCGEQFEN